MDDFIREYTGEEVPYIPDSLEYLFQIFDELSASRRVDSGQYQRIPHSEILAYAQLHHIGFAPWELRAIQAFDKAFLEGLNRGRSSGT